MAFLFSAEEEMLYGISLCESTFSHEILMAIDPKSVCMVGGPGTDYCLQGRCFEIVNGMITGEEKPRQDALTMASIDFYMDGSDNRTEVCRQMLAAYQRRHR